MEQSEFDALFVCLSKGVYPSDYGANSKRMLRRRRSLEAHNYAVHMVDPTKTTDRRKAENFSIDNGELFYVGRKKGDKPRKVIKTEEERRRILENCHGQTEGSLYVPLQYLC